MRDKKHLLQLAGILALALLLALLTTASVQDDSVPQKKEEKTEEIRLTFSPEVLTYDGQGDLDLLKGVYAEDANGKDLSSNVEAVMTSSGTQTEKKIRYTVFAPDGTEATAVRTLKLEGYTGPELSVEENLKLEASALEELIPYLKENNLLTAQDGFGRDSADQVEWVREKIEKGVYDITFTLKNQYLDSIQQTVRTRISGETADLKLKLSESTVTVLMGTEFDPINYVAAAVDPEYGNLMDRLSVSSTVNTMIPGTYAVVYTLTSLDNTQKAEAVLQVKVAEEMKQ